MTGPFRLDRALIRVSGPDAKSFLNNLLTQSLEGLDAAGVLYGALLTPQGKILADMLIWADGDNVTLEVDRVRAEELTRKLSLYKLRANVSIEGAAGGVLWSPEPFDGARADPRIPTLGYRSVGAASGADGANAYDAHRLALGVPDLAQDAQPDEVFALEALLDELHGVDFKKGCFIGQENVSRMKRRATTRKKFCPIVFDGDTLAPLTPVLAGEAEIGTVRSGAAGRAIALLRLDRAAEAQEASKPITANGRVVRLDPPSWLILPQRDPA